MDVYVLIEAEQMPWMEMLGVFATVDAAKEYVGLLEAKATPRWTERGDGEIVSTPNFVWDRLPTDVLSNYSIKRFLLRP